MVGVAHIWVCTRKEQTMAISVPVPKDLSGIKTKVALNLTKRQIICFSGAAITGVPLYFLTKGVLGTQAAALIMVGVMLPFFFLAMYERDGFPAEKLLYFMIRQKMLTPGIRPYKSENLYEQLEEREKIKKEVSMDVVPPLSIWQKQIPRDGAATRDL